MGAVELVSVNGKDSKITEEFQLRSADIQCRRRGSNKTGKAALSAERMGNGMKVTW